MLDLLRLSCLTTKMAAMVVEIIKRQQHSETERDHFSLALSLPALSKAFPGTPSGITITWHEYHVWPSVTIYLWSWRWKEVWTPKQLQRVNLTGSRSFVHGLPDPLFLVSVYEGSSSSDSSCYIYALEGYTGTNFAAKRLMRPENTLYGFLRSYLPAAPRPTVSWSYFCSILSGSVY